MSSGTIFVAMSRIGTIAMFAFVAAGCVATQKSSTFVDASNGIAYQLESYNDIFEVRVQAADSEKVLWHLKRDGGFARGPTRFDALDYGKAPPKMKEVVPAASLKAGDRVVIEVIYQYDSALTACIGGIRSEYEVTAENKFKRVVRD